MWLVMRLIRWEDLGPRGNYSPWPISFDPACGIGFMPVFDTKEEADREYPDAPKTEFTVNPVWVEHK